MQNARYLAFLHPGLNTVYKKHKIHSNRHKESVRFDFDILDNFRDKKDTQIYYFRLEEEI